MVERYISAPLRGELVKVLEEDAEEGQFIVDDDDGMIRVLLVADGDAVLIGLGFCQLVPDRGAQAGVAESDGGGDGDVGGGWFRRSCPILFRQGGQLGGSWSHVGTALVAPGGTLAPRWRALLEKHRKRVMIGTDTYVNGRWVFYEGLVADHRNWLGQLPRDIAEDIAFRNATRLFGGGGQAATFLIFDFVRQVSRIVLGLIRRLLRVL